MYSKWIMALFGLALSLPVHAKLYIVELRTRGQARGSIYYRESLELKRGVSEVIGEHSSRKGSIVTWLEEHIALVDLEDDTKGHLMETAEKTLGGVEMLTELSEVTDIKLDFRIKDQGSYYLTAPIEKLRILPAPEGDSYAKFNVAELEDFPSFKKRVEEIKIKSQQDGELKITIKTKSRARYLRIKGWQSFHTVGLDFRKMEKCESIVSSFTSGFLGKAYER